MSAVETILAAADIYDVRPLMVEHDGETGYSSCPCFIIETPEFKAKGHCWRVGCEYHPYSSRKSDGRCCLHVTGDTAAAEKLRALLDEGNWYGGWALEMEE